MHPAHDINHNLFWQSTCLTSADTLDSQFDLMNSLTISDQSLVVSYSCFAHLNICFFNVNDCQIFVEVHQTFCSLIIIGHNILDYRLIFLYPNSFIYHTMFTDKKKVSNSAKESTKGKALVSTITSNYGAISSTSG